MSLTAHVKSLEARKSKLDHLIMEETSRPMPNFLLVRDLKRKKLRIKERIHSLMRSPDIQSCA